jgi:hypothetical protein
MEQVAATLQGKASLFAFQLKLNSKEYLAFA